MNKCMYSLIQFLPLSLFATFGFWTGVPTNSRWLDAFQVGALLGLIQLVILLSQNSPLNRLVLAGNIYLILGGLAAFFEQWWYLELYDLLRESAIILLMVIVGCVSTYTSSSGFIGVKDSSRKLSIYLLAASCLMLPVAVGFEGNRTFSVVLPIIFLAIFQRYLSRLANVSKKV